MNHINRPNVETQENILESEVEEMGLEKVSDEELAMVNGGLLGNSVVITADIPLIQITLDF